MALRFAPAPELRAYLEPTENERKTWSEPAEVWPQPDSQEELSYRLRASKMRTKIIFLARGEALAAEKAGSQCPVHSLEIILREGQISFFAPALRFFVPARTAGRFAPA